ncbi:MAG: hypothetical protein ABSA13_07825 [Beijerinckiaceae bacterium]|jgi:hypothetical protein
MGKKPVQTEDETIQGLLEEFKKGAKLFHLGALLESREIELKAFAQYKEALAKLETKSPAGRDVLIPLLSDPDSEIRGLACGFLINRHPGLVMPILDEIIQEWGTSAAGAARNTKALYSMGLYDGV